MGSPKLKAFLDTHAVVALWEGRSDVWGSASREILERDALFVSPMVRLELAYLREIGRMKVSPDEVLGGLAAEHGLSLSDDRMEDVVTHAMSLTWTRDPFDRLIVATALLHDTPLVTKDRRILEHFPKAVW